jgi:hypothetical protein
MTRILLLAVLFATTAHAAETDQYYAWFVRIPDGTEALDKRINEGFDEALREVNGLSPESRTCSEVAVRMLDKHFRSATWFFIGATKDWGVPYRPASTTEFNDRYAPVSLYRYFGLLPFGVFVPLDPTVRVGDVLLGTDKIGHFLTNGPRYWRVYRETRAAGDSVEVAMAKAVDLGIEQEQGIMGGFVTSTFSYADLEANFQGLELIRSWCDPEAGAPQLVFEGGAWRLLTRFSMQAWVNPCWDESFYPNAYEGLTADGVQKALAGYCPLRHRDDIAARRDLYREMGCHSFSVRYLDALVARGAIPDNAPFTLERACGDAPIRSTR